MNLRLRKTVDNLAIQETCKLHVESLVARNELVACRQARQQSALLHPEDGAEGTAEEDALYCREGNQTGRKVGILRVNPVQSPLSLLGNTRNGLRGVEDPVLLFLVCDIVVNQERVCLTVDRFHIRLVRIEVAGLRPHHLPRETGGKILHNNTITGGEEAKDVLDEILLLRLQLLPVLHVL